MLLSHFNTYFLKHLKYLSVTRDLRQTCAIFIYRNIQLHGYEKSIQYQGSKIWNNKTAPNLRDKSITNFNRCYEKF